MQGIVSGALVDCEIWKINKLGQHVSYVIRLKSFLLLLQKIQVAQNLKIATSLAMEVT